MSKELRKAVGELVEVIDGNEAGDRPALAYIGGQHYARIERTSLFSARLEAVKKLLKSKKVV